MTVRSTSTQLQGNDGARPARTWFKAALALLVVVVGVLLVWRGAGSHGRRSETVAAADPGARVQPRETAVDRGGGKPPTSVPRFEPGKGTGTGQAGALVVNPRLASPERRAGETELGLDMRLRFNREYESFVMRARLTPEQERAVRQAFADAQWKRARVDEQFEQRWSAAATKAKRAGKPYPPFIPGEFSQEEKPIQGELDENLKKILTPEQWTLLQAPGQFITLQMIAGLGSMPFDIDGPR